MDTDESRRTAHNDRRPWLFILLLATCILHDMEYMHAPPIQPWATRVSVMTRDTRHSCIALPVVFAAVAMERAVAYGNMSLVRLAVPNPGVERNVIGSIISIVRYNMSVLVLTIEHAWVQGCERENVDRPSWLEVLAAYVPDVSSLRSGHVSSMKARYLPDTFRVDFTGVRFTVSMRYEVHHFGVHAGSGTATITGVGAVWLDDISLRLVDVRGEHDSVSIVCGGDIAIDGLVFDGDYHHLEGLYMEGGIERPDLLGYICDGFETRSHDPLATGWQWLGPGEPAPGLRDRVAGYIRTTCAAPTLLERTCGRCVLPYAWPAAVIRVTTIALVDDPIGFVICSLIAVYVIVYCTLSLSRHVMDLVLR